MTGDPVCPQVDGSDLDPCGGGDLPMPDVRPSARVAGHRSLSKVRKHRLGPLRVTYLRDTFGQRVCQVSLGALYLYMTRKRR